MYMSYKYGTISYILLVGTDIRLQVHPAVACAPSCGAYGPSEGDANGGGGERTLEDEMPSTCAMALNSVEVALTLPVQTVDCQ